MSVKMVRCSKGHFYNSELSDTCPQCAAEERAAGAAFYDSGKGRAYEAEAADDYGSTTPIPTENQFYSDVPPTEPVPGAESFFTGNIKQNGKVDDYNDETIPAGYQSSIGFSPVVGWLVCIDGPSKGKDYRVHDGYNYIGRSPHMQICIEGDKRIGRERHASIAYDPDEMLFFLSPVDGKSFVRLNDKLVMGPTQVNAYDVIIIGSTKLLLVPLCGERFKWDE